MPETDRQILRDLAKQVAGIAADPVQDEKRELWRKLNALEPVRPLVLIGPDTWHEMGHEIPRECEDDWARGQEWGLRLAIWFWENMPDDRINSGVVHSPIQAWDTGYGIEVDHTRPDHIFGAAMYNSVLDDDADPEKIIAMPEVSVDWDATEQTYERLSELYDGIMPVEKTGLLGHWFAIMDDLIQWRSIEQVYIDMLDRPEWVHSWMNRLTDWHISRLDQHEELGTLALNNKGTNVGPGGSGYTDLLPQPDLNGGPVRTVDQWGFATTQIFSEVSPEMHDEFAVTYEKRFLDRFGLSGYGCCEPLDDKVDILRKIPNLRRVSMSPWVDCAKGAEALGTDYIFSWKPNPAILGMVTWNEQLVRDQVRECLEKTRGCRVEMLMKDLHTCRGETWRMFEWVRIAMELAEEYA
ncbi:MAG TPA: hypothetical protein QGH10_20505 [Armatimonadota bacterium]|nr:hypothetical protein [Armatimonadota bacterium]